METAKNDIIGRLRREMLALSGLKSPTHEEENKEGLEFMQEHFPLGVLPKGAIHEFLCTQPEDITATEGFLSALIATVFTGSGSIVWITESPNIFPPALKCFFNDPSKIIFVHPSNLKECLWVMEETLKCSSIKVVIAEMKQLNFIHSRRFQLAVENSNVTGFVVNMKPGKEESNGCVSRWLIQSLAGETVNDMPGVGAPRWKVELQKIRNGKTGSWEIEWLNGKLKNVSRQEIHEQDIILQQQAG